jgi:hypothetical protein
MLITDDTIIKYKIDKKVKYVHVDCVKYDKNLKPDVYYLSET